MRVAAVVMMNSVLNSLARNHLIRLKQVQEQNYIKILEIYFIMLCKNQLIIIKWGIKQTIFSLRSYY